MVNLGQFPQPCPRPRLISIHDSLLAQARPFRSVIKGVVGTQRSTEHGMPRGRQDGLSRLLPRDQGNVPLVKPESSRQLLLRPRRADIKGATVIATKTCACGTRRRSWPTGSADMQQDFRIFTAAKRVDVLTLARKLPYTSGHDESITQPPGNKSPLPFFFLLCHPWCQLRLRSSASPWIHHSSSSTPISCAVPKPLILQSAALP